MEIEPLLEINGIKIGQNYKTYFIADIAANHDGDLARAKDLIYLAAEAGADVAKFQHFKSKKIVSGKGFSTLGNLSTHQSEWSKPVEQIYDEYHTRAEWDKDLIEACADANIEFMTTPYDIQAVMQYSKYCNALKIGSGDITYHELIRKACETGLPIIIATGASDTTEVSLAVELIRNSGNPYCLLQCNTNYTGNLDNFRYVNLSVLKQFAIEYPDAILGLSDHTPGHTAVLGAVSFGASVIEKHFTDNNERVGPDHKFALNPYAWREMVDRTRELELALGDGVKRVEDNEQNTYVVQRRAIRAASDLKSGSIIKKQDLEFLRPCPRTAYPPYKIDEVLGKTLKKDIAYGEEFIKCHIED